MFRPTLVLAAVAVCLLSFIVFFERGSLSTTEREFRRGRVLENFVDKRVMRIEVQRQGVTTVLTRIEPDPLDVGGYRVEAPYRAKADRSAVEALLEALSWAEVRRTLGPASAEDRKAFGLESPRFRVRYSMGSVESGLIVGADAPSGGGAYVQVLGNPDVYVVGGDVFEKLDVAPEDYHDKSLHDGVSMLTLEKLSLWDAQGIEHRIMKRDGLWWFDTPDKELASTAEVTALVNSVDAARAAHYVGEAAAPAYGLEKPRAQLTLESSVYDNATKGTRPGEPIALRVGAACAGHAEESYVQMQGKSVYCVADADLQKLWVSVDSLRETRLLPLEDRDISGVTLRAAGRELTLQTNDQATRYQLTEQGKPGANGLADAGALTAWYAALRAIKIARATPLSAEERARLEQDKGMLLATWQRGKDHAPLVLRVARTADGVVASRLDEPLLLHVPEAGYDALSIRVSRLRNKQVIDESEAHFRSLSIVQPSGVTERVVKEGSGYVLMSPQAAPADRAVQVAQATPAVHAAMDALLRLISKLEAQRFVADAELEGHGLSTPFRVVHIEYAAEGKTRVHTLSIGAETAEQGRFAKLDDSPHVFVVAKALIDQLDKLTGPQAQSAAN